MSTQHTDPTPSSTAAASTSAQSSSSNVTKEEAPPAAKPTTTGFGAVISHKAVLAEEVNRLKIALAEKEAELIQAATGGKTDQISKKSKKKSQANMIETDPVQGCRDFPPDEMHVRQHIFGTFHKVAKSFGFEEYDAPVLESEELYIRKAGEEITEQMFNFITKGGHRVALRPEMTPTFARLVLAKGKALLLPAKWYSIPQCWRYEAITRGRRREHYQWNMDIVGVKSVSAEAEVIAAVCTALEEFGLTSTDVGVKVNSRKILQSVCEKAGVPADMFPKVCVVVDKKDKIGPEATREQLVELKLDPSVIDVITTAMEYRTVDEVATVLGDEHESVVEMRTFMTLMESYGFADWIQFDAAVVRGLAYYTGIVFEAFDRPGKFRAIAGGGRYDNLMTTFGAPQPMPCVGFGFGDCVIAELLEEKKLMPSKAPGCDDLVIPFDESLRPAANQVLRRLRQNGRRADICLEKKKPKQAFAYADRIGADRAVFVAPDEWAKGNVRVKNLREGPGKAEQKEGEDKDGGTEMSLDELAPVKSSASARAE